MNAIASLGSMLADKAPELRGAIALVDSPRWPSDLDWSKAMGRLLKKSSVLDSPAVPCPACGGELKESSRGSRTSHCDPSGDQGPDAAGSSPEPHLKGKNRQFAQHRAVAAASAQRGREIDRGLRALVSSQRAPGAHSTLTSLSMFPTPPMRYFGAHLNSANCKPHLRRFGQELFDQALNRDYGPASGGIFTRFMIAGFAAYRALESIGADAYECYPDLQFRLWCRHHQLISKKQGRTAALASRMHVLSAVARKLGFGVSGLRKIRRLDEADAAILALSISAARQYGMIVILENPREGRFMAALDKPEALRFQKRYACRVGRSAYRQTWLCS
jgi:hypothetical protein